MALTPDQQRQSEAFGTTVIAEFLSAILVWTLIGFGFDRWLGTTPVLLVVGIVLGFTLGTYLVWKRYQHQSQLDATERAARG